MIFNWLRENTIQNNVVLTSPRLGMFVPGQTGARPFYGHPFETLDADTKKTMAEAFYRGDIEIVSPAPDFIIYGPAERALGGQPQNLTTYPIAFSTQNINIYKVK